MPSQIPSALDPNVNLTWVHTCFDLEFCFRPVLKETSVNKIEVPSTALAPAALNYSAVLNAGPYSTMQQNHNLF